jgi:vacuolar-type H+-ATPase subunit H
VDPETVPLREHLEALRAADAALAAERDRRYAEVKAAEAQALKVKEEADKTALGLQRETQTYKDEKANELREQINSERGLYATKGDLAALADKLDVSLKPLAEFVAGYRGGSETKSERRLDVSQVIAAIAVIALVLSLLIPHLK